MTKRTPKLFFSLIVLTSLFFGLSCETNYYPKPRGYFRIEFPEKEYMKFNSENCPFTFDVPVYSILLSDTFGLKEPCWYDLHIPTYKATIHLSYKRISNDFASHMEDTRKLVYKHASKADAINEYFVNPSPSVSGMIYEIGGNAASSIQFYVSDSSQHFLRGALYFNCAPNIDSLTPVIKYIEKDIEKLISTVEWK